LGALLAVLSTNAHHIIDDGPRIIPVRHDISGWGKALWVLAVVLTSYLGIFAYLITQGRGMAERNAQQVQQAQDQLRRVFGYSLADEITKLDQLKKSGSITDDEFKRLRAKLV